MTAGLQERAPAFTWRAVVTAAAGSQAAVLLVIGIAVRDREAGALGALTIGGIALLHVRRGLLGDVALGLLSADAAAWLAPAAADNISHHDRFAAIVVPTTVAGIALVGLAAVVGDLLARRRSARRPAGRGPVVVAAGGAALLVVTLCVALVVGVGPDLQLPPGAVSLSARNLAFSSAQIDVEAGEVTVAFTNHDLFWHTFTIDGLGVDLKVPVGGHRRVTFTANAGTYVFYCGIPGHRSAGMVGKLVVDRGI
jgi:plastocyanin